MKINMNQLRRSNSFSNQSPYFITKNAISLRVVTVLKFTNSTLLCNVIKEHASIIAMHHTEITSIMYFNAPKHTLLNVNND